MNITLPITDLSPRDLVLRTGASRVGFSCDIDGVATHPEQVARIIEHEVIVRVSGGTPCPADFDGDGELTIFDFLAFQNAFDAGCG